VEVRADPQAAVAAAPEEVPGGVRLDLEPRLCEPPRGERVRGVLLGRVAEARGADGVQLIEALEDAAHATNSNAARLRRQRPNGLLGRGPVRVRTDFVSRKSPSVSSPSSRPKPDCL